MSNFFFSRSNEEIQDVIGGMLTDTASIDFTYNDAADLISAVVLPAGVDHNSLANLGTGDVHTQYQKETDFTAGSVLFRGATAITESNAQFFWDNTNNRLGIGTASPANILEVNSGINADRLRIINTNQSGGTTILTLEQTTPNTKNWALVTNFTALGDFQIKQSNTSGGDSYVGTARLIISNAGNVGIGMTTPTAILHLKAGTATANTGPLKLTSGALLTTPEAGCVEFLTDAFYGTITTGEARKTFAFLESPTFTGIVSAPTLISTTVLRLKNYTVATLPAGTQGDKAFVTDALGPTYLATVVGGGAVVTEVFYNGTNWICT